MRGEHSSQLPCNFLCRGSSPRARGALPARVGVHVRPGIIPACAGSTCPLIRASFPSGDHPRVRGEHPYRVEKIGEQTGSSPRARGAHLDYWLEHVVKGIIPACAGSTRGRGTGPSGCRGSSPRARGAHGDDPGWHTEVGIIPACAGSTGTRAPPRRMWMGSSPRARGAPADQAPPLGEQGIIPACAGSTGSSPRTSAGTTDHPRVRGEHNSVGVTLGNGLGSSPRARGARRLGRGRGLARGIIPACAGSTRSFSSCSRSARDHPRVRGEHRSCLGDLLGESGSSPRARGARSVPASWATVGGIIPACAGSTIPMSGGQGVVGDHPRVRGEHMCPPFSEAL